MIDVNLENFETEVIQASMQTPVLVDFWAPWCGPCQTLGPILEKLELAYGGRFKLVKIDSDQEQQLAAMFGVRSIPTCVLMSQGQPVDGFMGALPESQLRAFLDKHLPEGPVLPVDDALPTEDGAGEDDDLQSKLERLEKAVREQPDDEKARFAYLRLLLEMGLEDEARAEFATVATLADGSLRYGAIRAWLEALEVARQAGDANARLQELDAAIATDKRDFGARYQRAQLLLAHNQWTQAMDELLEILMRDRHWNEERARKTYVAILEIIEPPKPPVAEGQIPPEDPVVASYRRRLSSVVLS
ncbi:thioredoxin [Allofranklinella schreckenbergeri]|uniref:Thioredoxin n=1 Tax=Allofranklinella schreckenbergeri TaxID=1076744 RepID=A0A3M6Q025_9BURK|nr:thioredoxin [Allofranklinella schreckenbergeri]RMW96276.1 thioredoxin [Allofranklinella schreckenbergeri]